MFSPSALWSTWAYAVVAIEARSLHATTRARFIEKFEIVLPGDPRRRCLGRWSLGRSVHKLPEAELPAVALAEPRKVLGVASEFSVIAHACVKCGEAIDVALGVGVSLAPPLAENLLGERAVAGDFRK